MQFMIFFTVKTLCNEMLLSLNLYQSARHHLYACRHSHFVVSHFELSRRTHRVSKLQYTILKAFLATYLGMLVIVAFAMMACGIDHTNAITISISCIGNVGPSLGLEIGPTMSWSMLPGVAKWLCSFMMLVGRLEIFTVLVILTPAFWKKN